LFATPLFYFGSSLAPSPMGYIGRGWREEEGALGYSDFDVFLRK
jgi:hypothetical protein